MAARGVAYVYVIAKCPNCGGPPGARSSQCPKKRRPKKRQRHGDAKPPHSHVPHRRARPAHQRMQTMPHQKRPRSSDSSSSNNGSDGSDQRITTTTTATEDGGPERMKMRRCHHPPPLFDPIPLRASSATQITMRTWASGLRSRRNAKALQYNVERSEGARHCLLETAVKRGTDLVLIQEPPTRPGHTHPGFDLLWAAGRAPTARGKDLDWAFSTEDSLSKPFNRFTTGDRQSGDACV